MKTRSEYNREAQERYERDGLCCICGARPRESGFKTCEQCRERVRASGHAYRRRLRMLAYSAYGGPRCACCGDEHLEFLTLDHIEGGGTAHRKAVGTGDKIYRWLRDRGYPEGFRVLCFNCNYAIFRYGTCPHEKRPSKGDVSPKK